MSEVLVVDSSAFCRELLGFTLEASGYAVSSASPEEAADRLRQSAPDVMILDPGLAESRGWRLLGDLRRVGTASKSPHIIIVTDQAGKDDVLRAAKLGLRDYMLKQRFSLSELLVRIQRYATASCKATPSPADTVGGTASPSRVPSKTASHSPSIPGAVVVPEPRARIIPGIVGAAGSKRAPLPTMRPPVSDEVLTDAAKEMGVATLTRDETLEKLDLAPVKTLPGVVAELISLVNSPRGSVGDVALILRRDPVMTARVLRVANSAAFSSKRASVATVEDAVKNIGVSGVRNLVVNVGIFDAFSTDASGSLRMTRVWQHCLGVAMLMEKLAPKDPSVPPGSAYLVGLCHDLADIVLRQHFPTQYNAIEALVAKTGCALRGVEGTVFGLPYADLVSHLLTRLGLPPLITLPIEEFFERGRVKGAAGTGSLLARTLRAMNVYAHGLMLAPGITEPLTPLTKAECANTFGDSTLSISDDETLRAGALTTASILAGLSSSQTQQMGDLLVPKQPVKVGYSRHGEYSALDPLATFLRLASHEVLMLPVLKAIKPDSLIDVDALIIAGPRVGGAEILVQELDRIGKLITGKTIPALYLAGSDVSAIGANADGVDVQPLPISIEMLGQFLANIPHERQTVNT